MYSKGISIFNIENKTRFKILVNYLTFRVRIYCFLNKNNKTHKSNEKLMISYLKPYPKLQTAIISRTALSIQLFQLKNFSISF